MFKNENDKQLPVYGNPPLDHSLRSLLTTTLIQPAATQQYERYFEDMGLRPYTAFRRWTLEFAPFRSLDRKI